MRDFRAKKRCFRQFNAVESIRLAIINKFFMLGKELKLLGQILASARIYWVVSMTENAIF